MSEHAFVLHLVRASARRENAQALLAECGMTAEIWAAVDGRAMSSTDLAACVGARLFAPVYPFGLGTGEIGCFLSHRQIWAEILRRDLASALIIEDDAGLVPETFAAALALARDHVADLGYVQFQTRPPQGPATVVDTNGPATLSVPRVAGLRTTAQMVSRAAAERLLHLSEAFDRPVDTFVQSHWHTGMRPAAIYPSGITDIADRLDGSTIQGGIRTPFQQAGREWARLRYRWAVMQASRHSAAPAQGGLG